MKFAGDFSLRKLLYNKRFTVTVSFILAFIIWVVITVSQKETMDRTFTDVPVDIRLENTFAAENKMNIIGDISNQRFTVVVRGPSYLVSSLSSSDIGLYASAAEVDSPGKFSLKVASRNQGELEYEVLSVSPSTVEVEFDYIETKEFTIKALANGVTAAEGLIAEKGVLGGTESDTVTISGSRTIINKIEKVVATADVNKTLSQSETFDANIILYDENGEVIDAKNLTLSTTNVKVIVPISKTKTVPVTVDFSNLPEGFSKSSITALVDHATVTVIGTPETVDKTQSVMLSAIDISTVSTSSTSFDVSPKLPDGVRLLDTIDHFTVTVNVEDYIEKTLTVPSGNVKYTNLSSGLSAGGIKSIKNVKICGPKSLVNKIKATDIFAVIDLTGKTAGEQTATLTFKIEGYNSVWVVGSYQTTVTIK